MKSLLFLLTAACLMGTSACKKDDDSAGNTPQYKTLDGQAPLVIAHRGASGLLPEHTLEAYQRAIDLGADFIEQDLVLTKDQVLVCRHEPMLSGTTNVASLPEFANRKTVKRVDGVDYNDWFVSDFTLAELRTIKAKQAIADRPQEFNGLYNIPTFQEVIDLAKAQTTAKGRTIGIYPETKHPTFHESQGLPLTSKLLDALTAAGWNNRDAPVFVQSFEVDNLRAIRDQYKSTVRTVQLYDAYDVDQDGKLEMQAPNGQPYDFVVSGDKRTYNDLATDAGLDFVKTYANGIGPWKPFIQSYTAVGKLPATTLIERAHQRGLFVHAYTFRDEPRYWQSFFQTSALDEYKSFYALGLDGVFSDYTATAVAARQ